MKYINDYVCKIILGLILCFTANNLNGATYVCTNDIADAFVTSGTSSNANPDGNYGGAGALMVSGSASGNGIFETLIKFSLSGAKASFDSIYGVGNWNISGISITLKSNFGIAGAQPNNPIFPKISNGGFTISWLSNDSWTEGTGNPSSASYYPSTSGSQSTDITYNNLSSFQSTNDQSLGSYTYTAPGNNTNTPITFSLSAASGFVDDITSGSTASLLFAPTDTTVSYLFNSRTYSAGSSIPTLTITAVPEPRIFALVAIGLALLVLLRRRKSV